MKVVENFESRPHNAVSFVVERDKEVQEWNEQKLPGALPDYSGGRLPGRSTKEKGREEQDSREKQVRNEVDQEVVAGIKKKTRTHKEQLGKVSSRTGIARTLSTERRRRLWTGRKKVGWKNKGMRMKSWRRFWNEEEWMEVPCRQKSCKRYLSW